MHQQYSRGIYEGYTIAKYNKVEGIVPELETIRLQNSRGVFVGYTVTKYNNKVEGSTCAGGNVSAVQ